MENLIDNLQKWLKRNKTEESSKTPTTRRKDSKERNKYTKKGGARGEKKAPHCIFCLSDHWSDTCKSFVTTTKQKAFFVENKLCFNCASPGDGGNQCRSRGCYRCGAKHHTSLYNQSKDGGDSTVLTGYTTGTKETTLPAIIPVKVKGEVLWAYLA